MDREANALIEKWRDFVRLLSRLEVTYFHLDSSIEDGDALLADFSKLTFSDLEQAFNERRVDEVFRRDCEFARYHYCAGPTEIVEGKLSLSWPELWEDVRLEFREGRYWQFQRKRFIAADSGTRALYQTPDVFYWRDLRSDPRDNSLTEASWFSLFVPGAARVEKQGDQLLLFSHGLLENGQQPEELCPPPSSGNKKEQEVYDFWLENRASAVFAKDVPLPIEIRRWFARDGVVLDQYRVEHTRVGEAFVPIRGTVDYGLSVRLYVACPDSVRI